MPRLSKVTVAAAVTLLTGAAQAQHVYDWNGFYIGGHAGYGWGDVKDKPHNSSFFQPIVAGTKASASPSAGAAGGHIGYNYQVGRSLLGLEAAFTWAGADDSFTVSRRDSVTETVTRTAHYDLDWLLAVAPRLGYAWHHWLAYVKGGVALGRASARYAQQYYVNGIPGQHAAYSESSYHVGPTLGLGIEYAFAPNWIFGVEYNYYGLGSQRYGSPVVTSVGTTVYADSMVDLTYQTVLARLSYRPGTSGGTYMSGAMNAAPPPRNAMWSGPYAGAHVGWGLLHADYAFVPGSIGAFAAGGGFTDRPDGMLAGIHLGYGQQYGQLVAGLEATASVGGLKASSQARVTSATLFSANYETKLNWTAAITPRIGLANGPWHIYAKGGAAATRADTSVSSVSDDGMGGLSFLSFKESAIHFGWTAGGGIEHALTPNWIFGVDVAYYDFGSAHYGGTGNAGAANYTVDLKGSTILARFSYNLAPPPP